MPHRMLPASETPGRRPRRLGVFLVVLATLGAFVVWGGQAAGFSTPEGLTWIVLGAITVTEGGALLLARCGLTPDWVGDLGLSRRAGTPSAVWALAAAVAVGYVAWTLASHGAIARHVLDVHPLKLLGLAAALSAGILEEVVFRRIVMDALARRGVAVPVQVLVSGLAFGAAHAPWGAFAGSLAFALGASLATSVLGSALAVVYVAGARRLGPCVLSHVAIDAALEPWLLYAALGGL